MAKRKTLPSKKKAFALHYVSDARWNASEAARLAGYSARTAGQIGYRLLKDSAVQAEIRRQLQALEMSAEEVLARLAEQARADIGPYIEAAESGLLRLDLEKLRADGKTHLIRKLSDTKEGIRVELHDGQRALELIGRYHGLFVERSFQTPVDEDFDIDEWRRKRQDRLNAVRAMPEPPEDESE